MLRFRKEALNINNKEQNEKKKLDWQLFDQLLHYINLPCSPCRCHWLVWVVVKHKANKQRAKESYAVENDGGDEEEGHLQVFRIVWSGYYYNNNRNERRSIVTLSHTHAVWTTKTVSARVCRSNQSFELVEDVIWIRNTLFPRWKRRRLGTAAFVFSTLVFR